MSTAGALNKDGQLMCPHKCSLLYPAVALLPLPDWAAFIMLPHDKFARAEVPCPLDTSDSGLAAWNCIEFDTPQGVLKFLPTLLILVHLWNQSTMAMTTNAMAI